MVADRVSCLKALVEAADQAHDDKRATDAIDKVANAGCNDDGECAGNLGWAATAEEGRGNQRRALALYRRAHTRAPDQDWPLQSIARLAGSMGLHAEAADAYSKLARRHPGDRQWTVGADEEHAAAVKAAVAL
jgi:tetratricopeptide (TPR) repeat protein